MTRHRQPAMKNPHLTKIQRQKIHHKPTITLNHKQTMKKVLLTGLLAATGFGLYAQKLDKAKDLLTQKKLPAAKTEIDGVVAAEKTASNPDAWYTRAKIYAAISKDSSLKGTVPDAREQVMSS